jgi:hypothetical protein
MGSSGLCEVGVFFGGFSLFLQTPLKKPNRHLIPQQLQFRVIPFTLVAHKRMLAVKFVPGKV